MSKERKAVEDDRMWSNSRGPYPAKQSEKSEKFNVASTTDLENDGVDHKKDVLPTSHEGDRSQQSESKDIDSVVAVIKKRCKLLEKFVDQSCCHLDKATQEATPDFQKLLVLLQMYRHGLAQLLRKYCYFSLINVQYETSAHQAEQLGDLAEVLQDRDLKAEAHFILWKSYISMGLQEQAQHHYNEYFKHSTMVGHESAGAKDSTALYVQQRHDDALTKSNRFLETVQSSQNMTDEYDIFNNLYRTHIRSFNIQESLDLNAECLLIASELEDQKKINDSMTQQGLIYLLMGKYRKSYKQFKSILPLENNDTRLKSILLCNLSVLSLIFGKTKESLAFALADLEVSKNIGNVNDIAISHGNVGLAKESMRDYVSAIEHFERCLELGQEKSNNRIINNSYCNLGRAYQGLGKKQVAKDYYKKALVTPQPPDSHWGDTEDFRFSPDYQLALMAIEEQNWPSAKEYLQQVVERCELLRKSVQDSTLKISFNDTQRKPFQFLQYVLLMEGAKEDALLIGEKGRGRDFYDKGTREGGERDCLNTPKALLDFARSERVAVLFLSTLDVVNEVHVMFIVPNGSIEEFSVPQNQWEEVLTELCVVMHMLQGRHKIEFRGIDVKDDNDDDDDNEGEQQQQQVEEQEGNNGLSDDSQKFQKVDGRLEAGITPEYLTGFRHQHFKIHSLTGSAHKRKRGPYSGSASESKLTKISDPKPSTGSELDQTVFDPKPGFQEDREEQEEKVKHSEPVQMNTELLSKSIDQLSKLVVKPIEPHLQKMVSDSTEKPKLLVIPQGKTFNIPYCALQLENGKPLCNQFITLEAFSFHSFFHSTKQYEKSRKGDVFEDALIVGNPTGDLLFAEEEAKAIAGLLGVKPLIGSLATCSEVISCLTHGRIIHFACHGEQNGKCLQMAPVHQKGNHVNLLTVKDIAKLTIRAEMVVLSACHTARGKLSCEGVLGLARAFLMAGALSVVTALWAIPDAAAKHFMEQFYGNLGHGLPVAEALSKTMCQMQDTKEYENVVHWGAFKVLGANCKVSLNKKKI